MSRSLRLLCVLFLKIYDTLPLLRRLPLPFQKIFKNYDALKKHTRDIIAEHKQTRVLGEPRDVIDCYLDEMEKVWCSS